MRKRGCNSKKSLIYCMHITGKGARKMKRFVSLLLSVVIILSLVCVAAPSVSAASAMKASTSLVNMIKVLEGFSEYPEEDNGQYSVGYGTGVSGDDLAYYKTHGISEVQATHLLEKYVAAFESRVNSFIDTHGLKLYQHQFDALVCFTYNCGYDWMNSGTLRNAVVSGATGNEFIFAMAQYGKSNGKVVESLITRRLCEANLYLNGVYSTIHPANYKYVIYDSNLEDVVPNVTIQGYDTTGTVAVKSSVSKTGYRFLGWYTKKSGGSCVTSLGMNTAEIDTLYAHWQKGDGELNEDGTLKGVAAKYSGYAPQGKGQPLYKTPGGETSGKVKAADTKLNVVAEYMDASGVKWGQLKDGKWIDVTNGLAATPVYEKASSIIDPITVTVTTNNVNNRIGPGTNYAKQGTYSKGQQLVLTAIQKGGNYKWGKSELGWIALQYTDYESASLMKDEDAKKVTGIATIVKTDILNVRAGAGVSYAKVGTYNRGDEVKITLRQKVGTTTWGLTEKGWISLYYAKVTDVKEGEVPDINISVGDTSKPTVPDSSTGSTGSTVVNQSGKIINCNTLRIRAGAGTGYAHIGNYTKGTYVNIYETVKVRSDMWGRTDKGWICLRYVQLDAPTTGAGVTGRVYNCTELNVRAGAGTFFAKVGKLTKGTKVEILEYTKVGKATWGRIEKGWISLYYVDLDAPVTNLDKNEGNSGTTGGSGSEPTVTEPATPETPATKYDITVEDTTNGLVGTSSISAAQDTVITLKITPDAGYELDTVVVKDASGTAISVTDNKFTMPASDVTVTATFKAQAAKYKVTVNSAKNGKVTASTASCKEGTEVVLTVAPAAGYELDKLTVLNTTTNTCVTVSGGKFTMPAGNVNVVATFKAAEGKTYDVTVNEMANGAVAANTTAAKAGDTITLTINPADGYGLDELSVKNSSTNAVIAVSGSGNTRTFTMPASDVTIAASFKIVKYTVSITAPENGSVSVNPDKYAKGAEVTLGVACDTGYELDKLTVKDASGSVVTVTNKKFVMPASDVTVTATFKKITYAVAVGKATNGKVTSDAATAKMGDTVTLTITPDTGYELDTLTVKDTSDKTVTVTDNKFTMPASSVSVSATFKAVKYNVEIVTPTNGSVSVNPDKYEKGATVTLIVKPAENYKLSKLTVKDADNKEITVKDNKFTMPAGKVTVTATFEYVPVKYKVTYTGGDFVNIRKEAATASEDLGDIANGTIIEALEGSTASWIKVKISDGKGGYITGWVATNNLTKV